MSEDEDEAKVEGPDWGTMVKDRSGPDSNLLLEFEAALDEAKSFSSPVQVQTKDKAKWWVKDPNKRVLRSLVTEHVVAEVGRLIGAPTCKTAFIEIPEGIKTLNKRVLEPGIGHASKDIPGVTEQRRCLIHRTKNDNVRRHVGLVALFDWCCGSDGQWLHDAHDDDATYGHDHGHFLPGGPNWTAASLEGVAPETAFIPGAETGKDLDPTAVEVVASKIEKVSPDNIAKVLREVPLTWNVSNEDLAALGHLLDSRRQPVADRLRRLVVEP